MCEFHRVGVWVTDTFVPLALFEYELSCMIMYTYVWSYIVMYDVWLSIVPPNITRCVPVWFRMAPYGTSYMAGIYQEVHPY